MALRSLASPLTVGVVLAGVARASDSWLVEPAGRQTRWLAEQAWILIGSSTILYLSVAIVFLIALRRGLRRRSPAAQPEDAEGVVGALRRERIARRVVTGASLLVGLVLIALLTLDLVTRRGLAAITIPAPRTLSVTGHQFWWQIEYPGSEAGSEWATANEIHIPVAEPILVRVRTQDVIHGFWVPSLAGKVDLVPGREASLWLNAEAIGEHAGRCTEFCGLQHAGMGFRVIVQSPEEFERWLAAQQEPARAPTSPEARRGREVFLGSTCVGCHTIRGTPARGRTGPDLTHLASRSTLGATGVPNEPRWLRAWIEDPQRVKPGNAMPASDLEPEELDAVVAYLSSLE